MVACLSHSLTLAAPVNNDLSSCHQLINDQNTSSICFPRKETTLGGAFRLLKFAWVGNCSCGLVLGQMSIKGTNCEVPCWAKEPNLLIIIFFERYRTQWVQEWFVFINFLFIEVHHDLCVTICFSFSISISLFNWYILVSCDEKNLREFVFQDSPL